MLFLVVMGIGKAGVGSAIKGFRARGWVYIERCEFGWAEPCSEGMAQHFAALVEGTANGCGESRFIVYHPGGGGTRHEADDGTIDFRWRRKGGGWDGEEGSGVAPQLCHQTEAAVVFTAWHSGDALYNFFLQHEVHIGDVCTCGEAVET